MSKFNEDIKKSIIFYYTYIKKKGGIIWMKYY